MAASMADVYLRLCRWLMSIYGCVRLEDVWLSDVVLMDLVLCWRVNWIEILFKYLTIFWCTPSHKNKFGKKIFFMWDNETREVELTW